MRRWCGGRVFLAGCLLLSVGCAKDEALLPPTPPMPADLSHWSVPELVQPDAAQSGQDGRTRPATPAEKVYDYVPGGVYDVVVALSAPLDLLLEPGEKVQSLTGSDPKPIIQQQGQPTQVAGEPHPVMHQKPKERWEYREAISGTGETASAHVLLRAFEAGATLGLTMTTNMRTYYLTCKSVQTSPIRVVRWRYLVETAARKAQGEKAARLLPLPEEPKQWHIGYTISLKTPGIAWAPTQVLDDGKKMVLLFPEITLFKTVPLVRALGPMGPEVVNSRQHLNVVILDALYAHLELRIGPDMKGSQAEVVTISQGALKTISCPSDPDCPSFPAAASKLAR
jgi:type IV secretory pathway VirB9-like protein